MSVSKEIGRNPHLSVYSAELFFDLHLQTKFIHDSIEVHLQIPRYHISEAHLTIGSTVYLIRVKNIEAKVGGNPDTGTNKKGI